MEHWILYYDRTYDAVPWPYSRPWASFVGNPEPILHATDDFGRASPCDGLSETPSVPADLPRAVPQGRYKLAVYHDPEFLYVFLDAVNAPAVITEAQLRCAPQLADITPVFASLAIYSPDARSYLLFTLDPQGRPAVRTPCAVFGPRAKAPAQPPKQWDFRLVRRTDGDVSCWRIARAELADYVDGDSLHLAVSRMELLGIESVAWGSQTNWAPRHDEMGTVRLVAERRTPPWPTVRRLELLYDPAAERGRFRILWNGAYTAGEETPSDRFKQPLVDWHRCAVRFNGQRAMAGLADAVETPEFPIADGINQIHVATCGGPYLSVDFEKRTGNRIVDAPLPVKPPADAAWVRDRIRAEGRDLIRELDERRASGEEVGFRRMAAPYAAAAGRAYWYLKEDPRLLEVLRDEADRALTMQRPDGTFSGLHLQRHGVKAGHWVGGAYDTGPAGELWALAAWLLGDGKYLDASRRLLRAYATYPIEFNHNYAAFTLYHLSAHYRLTRDPEAIERGLHYARHCVACDMLPLGYHSGHNFYSVYGAITLRGLAHFFSVLPVDHPYRPTLRELCLRMANQLISRQQPDGCFDARDRFFIGLRLWLGGLLSVAFLLDREDAARFDAVVQRMIQCPPDVWGAHPYARLCDSDFIRYFACRDRLLAGETIDLLELR